MRKKLLITAGALAGLACAAISSEPAIAAEKAVVAKGSEEAVAPLMEDAALSLLKSVSDSVSSLKAFKVAVEETKELPSTQGQMLTFVSDSLVTVQRPDRIKVETWNGPKDTVYLYDGKSFSVSDRTDKFYAVEDAPSNLPAMLEQVSKKHGITFAIADLLSERPNDILSKGLTHAYVVGKTFVDGSYMTQAAYAAPGLEFQIWADNDNLPKLMTVTYLDTPRPVHFTAKFSHWEVLDAVSPGTFSFAPPAGAQKIEFLKIEALN